MPQLAGKSNSRLSRQLENKGKVFPYSLPSVGPGADPGVQAVSPQVVTHQLQVERRTGKVRQSETDVLPLCHATNPEQTIAIRKRKFLNKFCVIHNALCRIFVAIAKTELESFCTDV